MADKASLREILNDTSEGYHFRMGIWYRVNGKDSYTIREIPESRIADALKIALKACGNDVDKALKFMEANLIKEVKREVRNNV